MILTEARIRLLKLAFGGSLILSVILGSGWAWAEHRLSNAKEVIQSLTDWQDGIIETTRLAVGSDAVITPKNAQSQIQELGIVRINLLDAVETQNTAIDALSRETEAARQVVKKAEQQRSAAIGRAEALQKKLKDRAGTPAADTNAAVRRTQDELYEAGL